MAGSVALLAACASSRPSSPPPDPAQVCLAKLDAAGARYRRLADWSDTNGCGITWAVEISRTTIDWSRPANTSCLLAANLLTFETSVLQPTARRTLNHSVVAMSHAGSYSCRPVRGGRTHRISQHALGKAIDITGFTLDDGTRITVLRDWHDPGAKGQFLHAVAQAACSLFPVVLTPNYDNLHRDHLHIDIGPSSYCGV